MTALTGREEEFKTIEDCVQRWISEDASMCLFVNGVPGTGKTATVSAVVNKFHHTSPAKSKGRKRKVDSSFRYVYINCHGLNKKVDFGNSILSALNVNSKKKVTICTVMDIVEQELTKSKTLLVLDEIDSLRVMGSALFADVFQWPERSDGNLLIIGISNVLNIVGSCLPKRFADAKPKTILFNAYTSDQIAKILLNKFKPKMIDEEAKALELTAKKVASMTGDVRRALSLAETMINMRPTNEASVGLSTPKKGQRSVDENMPPPSTPTTPRTPASACRDAIRLFNKVEASPIVRSKLPFQPKFILACIISLFSRQTVSKSKAQTVTKQEIFKICERAAAKLKLESCPPEGIKEGLEILKMQGMVSIGVKDQKVRVIVPAAEARANIEDNNLIAQINQISA